MLTTIRKRNKKFSPSLMMVSGSYQNITCFQLRFFYLLSRYFDTMNMRMFHSLFINSLGQLFPGKGLPQRLSMIDRGSRHGLMLDESTYND